MMEFVADPGTAWCGHYGVFEDIVQGVKKAGATAIKPQLWPKSVYEGHDMEREALKAHITKGDLRKMTEICVRHELSMFCSVFSIRSLQMMMSVAADYPPMGQRVKIPCSKNQDWKLLLTILDWEIDEVIISVASKEDVKALVDRHIFDFHSVITLLYCVPEYPTKTEDVLFPRGWPAPVHGFSDHTLGRLAPVAAASLGFDLIEKHVMLTEDQYRFHLGGWPAFPDDVCAVAPHQLGRIVRSCEKARRMAGYD